MLDTFIENSEHLLVKIKTALDEDDYGTIAEAAHRLLPSFEQLGLKEAMAMLKKIDSKFLRKKTIRKDPELIQAAINEIELALNEIKQAKSQFK
jgi:HPt (histidine-containing phosphotransfer) domain-containing protein